MFGKVCVFIDNNELFQSFKGMGLTNRRLDYIKLKEFLTKRRAADLRFYCCDGGTPKERKFLKGISEIGYTVIPNCSDWEIVYDMAALTHCNYKSFVLVAANASYAKLVEKIKKAGLEVEVVFFGDDCSPHLIESASCFTDLNLHLNKVVREYLTPIYQHACV